MSSAAVSRLCEFDFMQCEKCKRIATQPEMARALGPDGSGQPCPCGGMKLRPVNLPWWGWLLPRVWVFAWQRIRSQSLQETLRRGPKPVEVYHDHTMRPYAEDELGQLPEER